MTDYLFFHFPSVTHVCYDNPSSFYPIYIHSQPEKLNLKAPSASKDKIVQR